MEHCDIRLEKPTVRDRALRAIGPLGLSFALAASAIAGPAVAYADEGHVYESASIAVTQYYSTINQDAVFNAYKIFDADIDSADKASSVQWASVNAKTATLAFFDSLTGEESYSTWLTSKGYTQTGAHDNAQNAAEFIAERISSDDNVGYWLAYSAGNPALKVGGSFTDRLARAVTAANPAVPHLSSTITSPRNYLISGGTEGYYLIVTDSSSIGQDESGVAPMWVPMGGSLSTVQAKEASMTMSFTVGEDKTGLIGTIADTNRRQDAHYLLRVGYPQNLEAYSSFSDTYTFSIANGITTKTGSDAPSARINPADFQVKLSGEYRSENATATAEIAINGYDGVTLTPGSGQIVVSIADMIPVVRAIQETYPGFEPSILSIDYDAHLNGDAIVGTMASMGNETVLQRTYTADPVTLATTTSRAYRLVNTTYQAQFTKVDKANQQPLEGAGFHIIADTNVTADSLDASKQASDPVYVQADGSLGVAPYEFTTDANGQFSVRGLDEGVYVVHENTVPDGYEAPDSDATLTMTSSLNQGSGRASITASVSGGEGVEVEGDVGTALTSVNALNGLANVQIANERAFTMPYTGLEGNAGLYAVAASLGLAGMAAIFAGVRFNRREEERG